MVLCEPSAIHAPCKASLLPPYPLLHHTTLNFPFHSCSSVELRRYGGLGNREIHINFKCNPGCRARMTRLTALSSVNVEAKATEKPLKLMISGAPASGKGTQCELIVKKYGLLHISTGNLLRSEVAVGTETGEKAKEYMGKGLLVPDEIVTTMVKDRLAQQDAQEKGWLLDGYPRSLSQAEVLEKLEIRPDIFLLLDVPEEILIERVVGRRLDPVTGKIYHLKYFPPETEEIAARLTQRFDDTEEKVKFRLQTYRQNVEAVLSVYKNAIKKVDGNRPKEEVFEEIDTILASLFEGELTETRPSVHSKGKDGSMDDQRFRGKSNWKGIPTRLNNIPHSREIREYFYEDVRRATIRAVEDGCTRLKIEINIPELNPDMDVYRIGTLMELVRVIALTFADDGKRVKVCVQGSMGEGVMVGMPLQLAGTRKILEFMDWGEYDAKGTFISIGSIGAKEVTDEDDMFILLAPQNAVGNCIIDDLQAMAEAAGCRPVILVNPRLKDMPSAGGVMQTIGRDKRMEFAESFSNCYYFRLLYKVGTQYPIVGALRYLGQIWPLEAQNAKGTRCCSETEFGELVFGNLIRSFTLKMCYPYPYELSKRIDTEYGKEKYVSLATFTEKPTSEQINDAFSGRLRKKESTPMGFWGLLSSILS